MRVGERGPQLGARAHLKRVAGVELGAAVGGDRRDGRLGLHAARRVEEERT